MSLSVNKEELKALLETPLDPNLDYYDATASIEAIAKHIEGLHKLIGVMFESLAQQGASVIRMHAEIVELKADVAMLKDEQTQKSALILPDHLKRH